MQLKLIGLFGLVVFLALAWAISSNRKRFPWRTVLWGLGLQFTFALLILKTPWGAAIFDFTGRAISKLISSRTKAASSSSARWQWTHDAKGLPRPTRWFSPSWSRARSSSSRRSRRCFITGACCKRWCMPIAWVMRKAMRTSGSETLSAAANIFMGQTEAPLLIKPYIPRMTRSELLCMMIGGMATIAGGVAAVYAKMGVDAGQPTWPAICSRLRCSTRRRRLLISKVLLPETEASETAAGAPADVPRTTVNSIDALCRGAGDGMMLSINVIAMLIAFMARGGVGELSSSPVRRPNWASPAR